MRAHVSYARSLLTTSVEGRKVEMVTITAADGERSRHDDSPVASGRANDDANGGDGLDANGLDANRLDAIAKEPPPDRSSRSTDQRVPRRRVPRLEDRDVFVVTCGVHPGEKPANHLFNGVLEFLLRADDARELACEKGLLDGGVAAWWVLAALFWGQRCRPAAVSGGDAFGTVTREYLSLSTHE